MNYNIYYCLKYDTMNLKFDSLPLLKIYKDNFLVSFSKSQCNKYATNSNKK